MRSSIQFLGLTLVFSACGRLDLGGYYAQSVDPSRGAAGQTASDGGRAASAGQAAFTPGGAPGVAGRAGEHDVIGGGGTAGEDAGVGAAGSGAGGAIGSGGAAGNGELIGSAGAAGEEEGPGHRFNSCRNLGDECGLDRLNCFPWLR